MTATTVVNPQPQTTAQAPGGPFVTYSWRGNAPQYTATPAWGGSVTTPLIPVSGYARRFRVKLAATGGTGTATVAATADAPFSAVQQVMLTDPQGNNIINLPGWEAFKLVPIISGGFGLWKYADPANQPSYSAVATGADASGNFNFQSWLPLEFSEAIGVLGMDNASVLPSLQFTMAGASAVYSTAPTTLPSLSLEVDVDYYSNPDNAAILPPGLGSSRQFRLLTLTPNATNGSASMLTMPKFGGGYLDSLTFIARDPSTGDRTDAAWPARLQLTVDGYVVFNATIDQLIADMYNAYQFPSTADPYYNSGTESVGARPKGVLTIPFKNDLSQVITGLLDTGRTYKSTTPGTNIQLGGTGWQGSATYTCIPGLVIPSGTLVTGLPEA